MLQLLAASYVAGLHEGNFIPGNKNHCEIVIGPSRCYRSCRCAGGLSFLNGPAAGYVLGEGLKVTQGGVFSCTLRTGRMLLYG